MINEYRVDQGIRNQQWRVDAVKKMRAITYWFGAIIIFISISDTEDKWISALYFGAFPIIMGVLFFVRQVVNPRYDDLIIAIDYQNGVIMRNNKEKFNINDFGRIVCHKEGIKLFKRGYHSNMSYLSNYSDLNCRSWNILIPSIMEDFDEIKMNFKKEKWLK